VPCGIPDKRATSLEKLCGRQIESAAVAEKLARHIGDCFGREFRTISRDQLDSALEAAAGASATHAAALAPSI
jgi:hypothetical protein